MTCSLPGSSVHGISQARILEWCHFLLQGIFPVSQEIDPWSEPVSPALAGGFFITEPPGKSKEQMQMANRHLKRCSTLLIIREVQVKTTVRYHFTLVRMAIIKKSTNNRCWRRSEEKWTLLHCWWEYKLVQPLWKTAWKFPRKLKIKLPSDPAFPLLGVHPDKTIIQKDTCTLYVHNNTIYNTQKKKTQKHRWMDKEDVVQIYREILLSHIKEWNKPLAPTWMQLEIIILNEVR